MGEGPAARVDMAPEALAAALLGAFEPGRALDLRARRITGPVDLSSREICGFDLSGSLFEGPVTLNGAMLRGLTWWRDCAFRGGLSAENAVFGHDVRLDRAHVAGTLSLSRSELRGTLVLDDAHCAGPVWLDQVEVLGSLFMARAVFDAPVSVERVEALGGFWGDRARFNASVRATGMEVHGRNWLRGATVARSASAAMPPLIRQIHSFGYVWD